MNARDLPHGAREIAELRAAGKRPADMVLVSLIGPLRESNPVIVAKPGRAYDWRFLVGLHVAVVITTETAKLPDLVGTIDAAKPATLSVWFADRQNGLNVVLHGYRPKTKAGRRMGPQQRANLAGLGSLSSHAECLQQIAGQVKAQAMANADRFDAALVEMATAGFRRIFRSAWEAA